MTPPPLTEDERAVRDEMMAETARRVQERSNLKLTPEIVESIVALVFEGQWPHVAARSLGVVEGTFRRWMANGEEYFTTAETSLHDPDGLQAELWLRVTEAEARCEVDVVQRCRGRIDENKHWQGYMTVLARRFPERWGERREFLGEQDSWESQLARWEREFAANDRARAASE